METRAIANTGGIGSARARLVHHMNGRTALILTSGTQPVASFHEVLRPASPDTLDPDQCTFLGRRSRQRRV